MRTLEISIEVNGRQIPVGRITGTAPQDACFAYSSEYIHAGHRPISISLPLQEEPFTANATRNYFEGLLPEGFARKSVSEWLHADEDDYLTILQALGRECLGAIRVSSSGDPNEGYEALSVEDVKALAREGIRRSTDLVVQAHLSLTGASGKAGLYYDGTDEKWFLPKGTAPSTHIVKQSHVRLGGIVTNEQLSMMTAKALGLEVPESFIVNTGGRKDQDILFVTRRYDRVFPEQPELIDGLPRPLRLHQEDFAQALGIRAREKYEQPGQDYLRRIFEMLRGFSSDPINDQLKLWDMMVFDYLIGNTDNHIKNLSILYSPNLKSIRLAPAYDIVSTCVYRESIRQMAISIGGIFDIDRITRKQFETAAEDAGLGKRMAMERFDLMADRFENALKESASVMSEMGFQESDVIRDKILQSGGYRNL
ncbi:MAG: type II toxin-antitoxin system HipA family toxin [Oscillospiraceae bacterium]|nr:type II toxin-antitoxin system HipA family toxin [Oscillospiraceae bacterium]